MSGSVKEGDISRFHMWMRANSLQDIFSQQVGGLRRVEYNVSRTAAPLCREVLAQDRNQLRRAARMCRYLITLDPPLLPTMDLNSR